MAYSSWTDTAAAYYAQYYSNTYEKVGTINQNKAPGGYSYIELEDIHTLDSEGGHYSADADCCNLLYFFI